jgi:hypothetical protein
MKKETLIEDINDLRRDIGIAQNRQGWFVCKTCGFQESCQCEAYNKAIDDVLELLTKKK